jgi:death-on-curing protein
MNPLELDVALFAVENMPRFLGLGTEPMWQVNKRSTDELAGLLERPFQEYGGEELYKTNAEKVAILFFQTIKGHKFENGNKRTAVVLTLTFLRWNGYWLRMSSDEMYQLALKTADSANSKGTLEELNKVFAERIERASLFGIIETWVKMLWKSAFEN